MSSTPGNEPLWTMSPGWGIAADLTPPELINARQLTVVRRFIFTGLALLLVLCVGGYALARQHESDAATERDAQQLHRIELQRDASQYAGITKLQVTVTQIQTQIATVMVSDIDVAKLLGQVRSRLPSGMTITQASILLTAGGADATAGGLDASGRARIGNITISGAGRTLLSLATYVDSLSGITGVVDVIPLSNAAGLGGMQFSLSLGLTDELLSHRFDAPKAGGN